MYNCEFFELDINELKKQIQSILFKYIDGVTIKS